MNSKSVLSKISKLLNFADETTIQAKTDDGKILTSANFDLNDAVLEVAADGTTAPLADGEYTITYTTPEGVDVTAVVDIDGGKIAGISTPEEEADEEAGTDDDDTQLAATTETAKSLPNTTNEDPTNKVKEEGDSEEPVISLSDVVNRLAKLEAAYTEMKTQMESAAPTAGAPLVSSLEPTAGGTTMSAVEPDEDEDLPKLDGAPIDPLAVEQNKNNYGKKPMNYQSSVLSKMYK